MQRRMRVLIFLLGFLRPFVRQAAFSVLLGVATVASGIGLLGTSAYLIAYAALQPSVAALQVAIVGVRFFGISRALFRYLERLVSHGVNFRLLGSLRVWFYQKLEPLAPARLQDLRSADLLSRAIADIEILENFYVRAVTPPLVALVVTAGTGLFVGIYAPRLAVLLVGLLLLAGIGLPLLVHRLAAAPGRDMVERRGALNNAWLDLIQGMPDILAFGSAQAQLDRIAAAGAGLSSAQRRLNRAGSLGSALGVLITGLGLWGVLLLAIPLVGSRFDGISLAVLALVALASFEAVTPLTQAAQHLESSLQAARRLIALVDLQPEIIPPAQPLPLPSGGLDLRIAGLDFAYGDTSAEALSGLDLDLPAGKRVALVGPSGAGKTTLFNLLLRFWEFERGQILLDGRDIRCYAPEEVRARMALIAQSTYLFAGTLRQNILLAKPDAAPEALRAAVETSQLSEWIASLPDGLDTWVGERGLQLSGGERQRVAVARAVLRGVPLLLLDEPTANLDAATERRLLDTLHAASAGRSLIVITHRLVRMEDYDEILVLRRGQVAERGKHADLLAARGIYAQMWRIQSETL